MLEVVHQYPVLYISINAIAMIALYFMRIMPVGKLLGAISIWFASTALFYPAQLERWLGAGLKPIAITCLIFLTLISFNSFARLIRAGVIVLFWGGVGLVILGTAFPEVSALRIASSQSFTDGSATGSWQAGFTQVYSNISDFLRVGSRDNTR